MVSVSPVKRMTCSFGLVKSMRSRLGRLKYTVASIVWTFEPEIGSVIGKRRVLFGHSGKKYARSRNGLTKCCYIKAEYNGSNNYCFFHSISKAEMSDKVNI